MLAVARDIVFNKLAIIRIGSVVKYLQLALIKAFAPVYPLIQLAYYSCKYEKNQSLDSSLGSLLTASPILNTGMFWFLFSSFFDLICSTE